MANFNVTLQVGINKGSMAQWSYNSSTTGVGTTSGNPLDVQVGDTVTFIRHTSSAGSALVQGLAIFTNNANISISSGSVVRTVASGALTLDTITGLNAGATVSDLFYIERQAAASDTTPNAFSFTDVTSAAVGEVRNTYVQITGIDTATAVTRTGSGTFSISSTTTPGSFGTTGNISNNQYLHVRQTASGSNSTTVSSTYTVGGVSDIWYVTTVAASVVAPDTNITDVDTITRPNGSTNHSITIAAGSSNTIYEARTGSASGTVVGTRTGNGAITVASIPSAGTSATYYITGRVTTANNGSNAASIADTYIVLHEAENSGSTVGDGGTGTYGLKVYDSAGNVTLDVSDRVVIFRERVQGSLTASQTTKTVTLSAVGTSVINLDPIQISEIYDGNIPQRQKILYFTVSGTTLTIQRTAVNARGSSSAVQTYDLLVVYDPE